METPASLLLTLKNEPVHVFDKTTLKWIVPRNNPGFADFVNRIALESSKAQGLKRPLTTFTKLVEGDEDQNTKLYILWQKESTDKVKGPVVFGYAKTTQKQLYLRNEQNQSFIHTTICIMDFYIHESVQRQGHGVQLFNFILENEKITAAECAFDSSSKPLLAFLSTHYNLSEPILQSNRFLVFKQFFDALEAQPEVVGFSSKQNSRASSRRSSFGKGQVISPNRNGAYADKITDIIHPTGQKEPEARVLSADTPQGRKYNRDFGHQNIW